jgi:ABC-type branched-subunit amino acid transport system substrate-binding protein
MERLAIFFGMILLFGHTSARLQPSQKTPEERGKEVYLRGASPSDAGVTAQFGEPPTEVDGSLMPCVNCHGSDGKGKPEGGLKPTNITWEALTRPYGVIHAGGRTHPPYTERLLARAISLGIDPGGNKLHSLMPRFQMSRDDIRDLIEYLKRLGTQLDPGLTDTGIKIGTLIPKRGPLAGRGRAAAAILSAYFDEVNRLGGLYSRKIELCVAEAGERPDDLIMTAENLVDREQVFALIGAFIAGADEQVKSLCEARLVPLIGPSTLVPDSGAPSRRYTFHLLSGLKEQGQALARFAVKTVRSPRPRVAVLSDGAPLADGVPETIVWKCRELGWGEIGRSKYSAEIANRLVHDLSRQGVEVVFFPGSGANVQDFAMEAARLEWTPYLFLTGALVAGEQVRIPAGFKGKVFMSFPNSPADYTQEGMNQFRTLAQERSLAGEYTGTQISAYAASKVLVAALRVVGRELSREKLVAALEGLSEFETGLTPRISFGPNRRIGALGAYIVAFDVERGAFSTTPEWVSAE